MTQEDQARAAVDRFVFEEIDSVPHIEALLLLWTNRPKQWSPEEMAKALFISAEYAHDVLRDLEIRKLAKNESQEYLYNSDPVRDGLIAAVDRIYRRELVRISNMIHSKPSLAVREFARAFRLKKD